MCKKKNMLYEKPFILFMKTRHSKEEISLINYGKKLLNNECKK